MEKTTVHKHTARKMVQKSASSAARGCRRMLHHSYEKQWARERKQAYAGEHITYKVDNIRPSKFTCNCTICPCKHM